MPLQVDTVGLGLMLIVGVTGLVMLKVVAVLVAVALVTQLALLVSTQVIEPPVVPGSLYVVPVPTCDAPLNHAYVGDAP